LLLRMKDDYDGAEPSGNSLATDLFLRLAHVFGDDTFAPPAQRALSACAAKAKAQPTMAPQLLCAVARLLSPPEHFIVRVADEAAARSPEVLAILQEQRKKFQPFRAVFALVDGVELSPFLASLKREKRITIYQCENLACALPVELE